MRPTLTGSSQFQVIEQLGLIDRYFELPVQRVHTMKIVSDKGVVPFADFGSGKGRYRYVTYVPQWDFLRR